jgi:hypothetical protein
MTATTAASLFLSGGRTEMDRISESLLNEFSGEHGITSLSEDKRFEHFASFVTARLHFSETFDTADVVTGSGADTGIDGIAIIVNGSLVTDLEELNEQSSVAGYLDVTFVFVQARTSAGLTRRQLATSDLACWTSLMKNQNCLETIRSQRQPKLWPQSSNRAVNLSAAIQSADSTT